MQKRMMVLAALAVLAWGGFKPVSADVLESDLVGKWVVTHTAMSGSMTFNFGGEPQTIPMDTSMTYTDSVRNIEFFSGGQFASQDYVDEDMPGGELETTTGTWTLGGDKLIMVDDATGLPDTATVAGNSSPLTLTSRVVADEMGIQMDITSVSTIVKVQAFAAIDHSAFGTPLLAVTGTNPFISRVTLGINAADGNAVDNIRIYNQAWQMVREVVPMGYSITWDGRDSSGREVPAGVYVVRYSNGNSTEAVRIIKAQ